MQIDQKTIQRLLSMNDEKLASLIEQIARQSGIPPESLGISPGNIQSIRSALSNANADDLARMNRMYEAYRKNGRPGGAG